MAIIPPGFAEVVFKWVPVAGYRECMTSWGFTIEGWDEDTGPINDAWGDFFAAIGEPSTATTTGIVVRVGTSDPSAPIVYEDGEAHAGSGGGAIMSPQVCMLASKRTALGGRAGRGRSFLPAPLEGQVNNAGQLDETFRGNVEDALVDMLAAVQLQLGLGETGVVLLHSDALIDPTQITGTPVETVVATQRNRLVR